MLTITKGRGPRMLGVLAGLFMAVATFATPVAASDWPSKTIRIIVPFPPGGLSDVSARKLAQKMTEELDQSVIVENRPGAGGVVGTEVASRTKPDGYTLLVTGPHHVINQAIRETLPYNALEDFRPIASLVSSPLVLAVNVDVPVNTLDEFIEFARAQEDGGAAFGSSGIGGTSHLAGEIFALETDSPMMHVAYGGTSPLLQDFIGGQISATFLDAATLTPLIESNRVKGIATVASERSIALPDIPSTTELGYPGIVATTWMGFYAPAGTPEDIIVRLNDIARSAFQSEEQQTWLRQNGAVAGTLDSDEIVDFVHEEYAKWKRVAEEANVRVE